jgi:hypothetical protein
MPVNSRSLWRNAIVDEDEQDAARSAVFEPLVIAAVDLDQLAETGPTRSRLMHATAALSASLPSPVGDHPLPQRLD